MSSRRHCPSLTGRHEDKRRPFCKSICLAGRRGNVCKRGRDLLIQERAGKERWGTQPNLCGFLFSIVPRIRASPWWPHMAVARQAA